jgi:hypothetical protein
MGKMTSEAVVLGRIRAGGGFVLFRPRQKNEPNLWRSRFIEESQRTVEISGQAVSVFDSIDIPAFLFPVRARIRAFDSCSQAGKAINRHWSDECGEQFEQDLEHFRNYINTVYARDRGMMRFGVFGIYTRDRIDGSKPKLQSVFTLLPGSHDSTTSIIPVVVSNHKAPWNVVSERERLTHETWKRQHWGIDLSTLIFAIKTYFKGNPASFEDEVVAAWRFKLMLPESQPAIEFRRKTKKDDDVFNLEIDLEMLGFNIEDLTIARKKLLPHEIVYDLSITADQAGNIVDEYRGWASRIFVSLKSHN